MMDEAARNLFATIRILRRWEADAMDRARRLAESCLDDVESGEEDG